MRRATRRSATARWRAWWRSGVTVTALVVAAAFPALAGAQFGLPAGPDAPPPAAPPNPAPSSPAPSNPAPSPAPSASGGTSGSPSSGSPSDASPNGGAAAEAAARQRARQAAAARARARALAEKRRQERLAAAERKRQRIAALRAVQRKAAAAEAAAARIPRIERRDAISPSAGGASPLRQLTLGLLLVMALVAAALAALPSFHMQNRHVRRMEVTLLDHRLELVSVAIGCVALLLLYQRLL